MTSTPSHSETPVEDFDLILKAGRAEKNYWHDLWRYRELFIILALRDISVRYKQTVIGVAWALIQPFLNMLVMTVVFGKVAGLKSDGNSPYALMVFAGMLPWMFFSSALTNASQSMVVNSNLISKVYFPRLIVPASAVVTAFADFVLSFIILIGVMIWYRFLPSAHILVLPLFVGMAFLAALGPGLFVTALNVKYRDFRYVIPFLVQFGIFVSPVGFSTSVIRQKYGQEIFLLYFLNPMTGVIDGFRWAILGSNAHIYVPGLCLSLAVTAVFLWIGISYFRKTEKSFADVI